MAAFNKLVVKSYPRIASRETSDTKYWNKYSFPITVKESSAISFVNFSQTQPHDFAVTTSNKVQIYSSTTNEVKKTLSRFKEQAYSGCFRPDGKLLVAGTENGIAKVFDASSRVVLREFTGHTRAVHSTRFSLDGLQVLSTSDDCSVRLWDLSGEKEIFKATEHKDYVRTSDVSSSSNNIWLTGSYDHTVKMWDNRSPASVMTIDHGHPVEDILVFPSGGLCASAGHNMIKIWDILAGGRLVAAFTNHQKTITSLCFDGQCTRLLSASLDRHVKIYDVKDYKVVHSIHYPSPILSVGISLNDKHIVVGMSDGLLSIKYRTPSSEKGESAVRSMPAPRAGSYRYFLRGKNQKPEQDDFVVTSTRKPKLSAHDKFLKNFEYTNALDSVLQGRLNPPVVISLIMELIRRQGLQIALSGRDEDTLLPILSFLNKHICNPRYTPTLIDVTNTILDIYGPVLGQSPKLDDMLAKLKMKIASELNYQKQAFELMGSLDTIFAVAASNREEPLFHNGPS
ncbi:U3 small nucleolar RNA-associated protein 15 homolog [Dendronephthya gigantea]|uniref:U3 small nucleolar RNA-associated protein 15 homolog n=1 Tax=Dendronephthya gigantea TaxID=151771 RepID=UPI00106BCFD9|nr:U3 small nucleolar RNA-associated protein 15 homolog [Dendronephthya gigantea]